MSGKSDEGSTSRPSSSASSRRRQRNSLGGSVVPPSPGSSRRRSSGGRDPSPSVSSSPQRGSSSGLQRPSSSHSRRSTSNPRTGKWGKVRRATIGGNAAQLDARAALAQLGLTGQAKKVPRRSRQSLGGLSGSSATSSPRNLSPTPESEAAGGAEAAAASAPTEGESSSGGQQVAGESAGGSEDSSRRATLSATAAPAGGSSADSGSVRVVCRFRPLSKTELQRSSSLSVQFPESEGESKDSVEKKTVLLRIKDSPHTFNFDRVFPPDSTQAEVYEYVAKPVVLGLFQGYNGTLFAYGQTGAGKTHTMEGDIDSSAMRGIIPRMVDTVFNEVESAPESIEFTVKVGMVEIYQERVRDLLHPENDNLSIHSKRDGSLYIQDLTEVYVTEASNIYDVIRTGGLNRSVAATKMNDNSSRSHSVFIMSVNQTSTTSLSTKTGKLYLVDLAGSEKIGKTGVKGQQLEEAKNINKSLSALGNVINALTDGRSTHIPYRDSKLTRMLQESLGGNSRTALIMNCSPAPYNVMETASTLRFGTRAKRVQNKPRINKERSLAELKVLVAVKDKEIAHLKRRVKLLQESGGGSADPSALAAERKELEELQANVAEMVSAAREEEQERHSAQLSQLEASREQLQEALSNSQEQVHNLTDELEVVRASLDENRSLKQAAESQRRDLDSQITLLLQSLQVFSQATVATPQAVIDAVAAGASAASGAGAGAGEGSSSGDGSSKVEQAGDGVQEDATASVEAELDVLQSADFFTSEAVSQLANLTASSIRSALDSIAAHTAALREAHVRLGEQEQQQEERQAAHAAALDSSAEDVARLQAELESAQRRLQQSHEEMGRVQESCDRQSTLLLQLETKLDAAERELKSANMAREAAEVLNSKLKTVAAQQSKDSVAFDARVNALTAELAAVRETLASERSERTSTQALYSELQGRHHSTEEQLRAARAKADSCLSRAAVAEAEVAATSATCEGLRARQKELVTSVEQHRNAATKAEGQLKSLSRDLDKAKQEAATLQQQVDSFGEMLINAKSEAAEEWQEKLARAEAHAEEVRAAAAAELQEALADAEDRHTEALQELESRLKEAASEHSSVASDKDAARVRAVEDTNASWAIKLRAKENSHKRAVEKLEAEVSGLQTKLAEVTAEAHGQEMQLHDLRTELRVVNANCKAATERLEHSIKQHAMERGRADMMLAAMGEEGEEEKEEAGGFWSIFKKDNKNKRRPSPAVRREMRAINSAFKAASPGGSIAPAVDPQTMWAAYQALVQQVEKRDHEHSAQIEALMLNLADRVTKVTEVQMKLDAANDRIRSMAGQVRSYKSHSLEARLREKEGECQELEAKLQDAVSDKRIADKRVQRLQAEIKQLKASLRAPHRGGDASPSRTTMRGGGGRRQRSFRSSSTVSVADDRGMEAIAAAAVMATMGGGFSDSEDSDGSAPRRGSPRVLRRAHSISATPSRVLRLSNFEASPSTPSDTVRVMPVPKQSVLRSAVPATPSSIPEGDDQG